LRRRNEDLEPPDNHGDEALRRLAARVDVPELSSFVRAVVQADQLGTSMANILRV
jgi:tight adherence protein C